MLSLEEFKMVKTMIDLIEDEKDGEKSGTINKIKLLTLLEEFKTSPKAQTFR